jgi:PEGA domain-containing protein
MRNALAGYDDQTQLALARRDALLAAANAAVAWAHKQSSARPSVAARPAVRAVTAAATPAFSSNPLMDAARTAGGAGLTAARGARSAARALMSGLAAIGSSAREAGLPILRALPIVAVVAVVAAGIWLGVPKARPYVERWKATPPIARTVPAVTDADLNPTEPVGGSKKRTGRLVVTSASGVAQVLVDGQARGLTPLTLDGLAAGKHTVVLRSQSGSVEQTVTVAANETAQVDQTIFPGWVSIVAPWDLAISEGNRSLRLDDRSQVMLPPGPHELLFRNRALGYEEVRRVDVRPGETTQLSIAPPRSKATFTATAPAEVWLDGKSVGQTPLIDFPVEIGTHHVKMKSATAERQFTVTATMTPLAFNVDFSQ